MKKFSGYWNAILVLGVLALFGATSPASAQADIAQWVQVCPNKSELQRLIYNVRAQTYADEELAQALAAHLRGGSRWFARNGYHSDPIDDATWLGGTVVMTYRRDGRRWGWAEMSAHRVGGYVVLVGDFYQQSKMHGGSTTTPPIPLPNGAVIPSLKIKYGWLFKDDHGGCAYVFRETASGFEYVNGTGVDYGDNKTLPNWLTGGNGR